MDKQRGLLFVYLLSGVSACTQTSNTAPDPAAGDVGFRQEELRESLLLPTGARISPLAADGSTLVRLNPGLPTRPDFVAGQPETTALSPDGRTLLVLTTG